MEIPPNSGNRTLLDVHGAGAQRSDFKTGDPSDYPDGHGPQGDVVRIFNYVRLVRYAVSSSVDEEINSSEIQILPNSDFTLLSVNMGSAYFDEAVVCNIYGEKLLSETLRENQTFFSFDISTLSSGAYFVLFSNDKGIISKRLTIIR